MLPFNTVALSESSGYSVKPPPPFVVPLVVIFAHGTKALGGEEVLRLLRKVPKAIKVPHVKDAPRTVSQRPPRVVSPVVKTEGPNAAHKARTFSPTSSGF